MKYSYLLTVKIYSWHRRRNEEKNHQAEINVLEDNISDRDITDALVGKKVKALYENECWLGIHNIYFEVYKVI